MNIGDLNPLERLALARGTPEAKKVKYPCSINPKDSLNLDTTFDADGDLGFCMKIVKNDGRVERSIIGLSRTQVSELVEVLQAALKAEND